jgi:hypothetical protein
MELKCKRLKIAVKNQHVSLHANSLARSPGQVKIMKEFV